MTGAKVWANGSVDEYPAATQIVERDGKLHVYGGDFFLAEYQNWEWYDWVLSVDPLPMWKDPND